MTKPTASGRWPRSGSEGDVLLTVDAEEHDDEQEEDHDGPGVDNDLHRGCEC